MTTRSPYTSLDVARELTRSHLKYFVYVWGAVFAATALIVAGVAVFAGTVNTSFLVFSQNPTRYWFFVSGILMIVINLRIYVTHGVTRRSFAAGGSLAGTAIAAAIAAMMALGFGAEHLVYQAAGWQWEPSEGLYFSFTSGAQTHLIFAEYLVVYASHFLAGVAAGLVFIRLHWTLAVPASLLAYAGAAGVEAVLGVGWPGRVMAETPTLEPLPFPAASVAVVALVVAMAGANQLMLRDVPVAKSSTMARAC
ncbi:MAG: hypothetical protein ACRDXX_12975 [Stackebrandtia sp.]